MKKHSKYFGYCFGIILCLAGTAVLATSQKIRVGENAILSGKFVEVKGVDIHEKPVTYHALQLNQPIIIVYEDGEAEATILKLWLNKDQALIFEKLLGKQVSVSGKIHYYWFGPSTMPNPAKLQVTNIFMD